jgi:hypothetical protein
VIGAQPEFAVLQLERPASLAARRDAAEPRCLREVGGFLDPVEAELFGFENYQYFEVVPSTHLAATPRDLPHRPTPPVVDSITVASLDPVRALDARTRIARALHGRRRAAGMEAEEVAAAADVDPVMYAEVEAARRLPDQVVLHALAEVLGLDLPARLGPNGAAGPAADSPPPRGRR